MGLNDIVEKEEKQAKVDHGDQSELDEHLFEPDIDEEEQEQADGSGYSEPHRKPCHDCGYLGAKHVSETEGGNRDVFWKCGNPNCNMSTYLLGWNEWRNESDFLGEVHYEGWRVDQDNWRVDSMAGE